MKEKLFFKLKFYKSTLLVLMMALAFHLFANEPPGNDGYTKTSVLNNKVLSGANSVVNLYMEGDAADPYNETNSVGNWQLDESVSPDQTSFQSVSGGTNGLYSIMVKSEGWGYDNWGRIAFTFDGLDPNKSYKISWDAKSDDGAGNYGSGFVHLVGGVEDLSFRTTSTNWNSFSVCLTPENTSITLKIYPTAGRKVHEEFYIDNLYVVEDGCDDCEDNDNDGVCADVDCDDRDASVTTSSADDTDGDGVNDCEDVCEGFDDNADADGDGIPDGCDDCVITTTPECTILASDEVKLDDDNTIIGGACEEPALDLIPPFYFNTVSNGDSPDLKVEEEDGCVTTDVEVFNKVEVKEGGCLIFTGKNIFIKELKVKKRTTIKFEDCSNVIIDKKLKLEDFTTFNPDMQRVRLYVDGNVEVKKGSNVSAHIYALDHDIKAEGKEDSPTTMKGVFVGKKVEGKYFVNWIGADYCDPCPVEYPEPEADCECEGGMLAVTFTYDGDLSDLSSNDGTVVDNGDGTFTVSTTGDKLEKNLEITTSSGTAEIHTSCSQEILGVTFPGGITVVSYLDKENTLTSLENCPPVIDCECKGGMVSVTFGYSGMFDDLSTNSGTINDNGDGTFTISTTGDKLKKDLEITTSSGTAEIHTSCSQDILGVTFTGGVEVLGYIDKEGNITSVDGCSQAPGPDCECKGGMVSVTFSYNGSIGDLITNSGTISDNGDGTFTVSTTGDKLEKDLEITTTTGTAEIHTSCSQDILGIAFPGGITVTGYIDTKGSVTSIDTCPTVPVECDCDGKIVKMSVVYHGPSGATITVGADENGNNTTTYTDVQFEQILEVELGDIGNWWYYSVNGNVDASIHTSCSDDILGNVDSTKSIFGDLGDFPDPEDGDNNGTFLVISHTDSNGNVCSIDYAASFRTSMRTGIEEAKPVSNEFSVNAWPNPADNQFNIRVLSPELKDKVNLEVIDIRGRVIHKDQFNTGYDYTFGTNLKAGLYFVRVQQGDSVETIKLMKR